MKVAVSQRATSALGYNALRSSGTSPNFLITLASLNPQYLLAGVDNFAYRGDGRLNALFSDHKVGINYVKYFKKLRRGYTGSKSYGLYSRMQGTDSKAHGAGPPRIAEILGGGRNVSNVPEPEVIQLGRHVRSSSRPLRYQITGE
jgi:hypothetical protein